MQICKWMFAIAYKKMYMLILKMYVFMFNLVIYTEIIAIGLTNAHKSICTEFCTQPLNQTENQQLIHLRGCDRKQDVCIII